MGSHLQWIELDECILSYIDESEQSVHRYAKLWQIAYRAMTELGLDFFYTIQSKKLPVNANLTVNLPSNYLNYSKVGVFNDRSEIIPLSYNDKLTFFADQLPNRATKTEDVMLLTNFYNTPWAFNNFWNNGTYETIYGLPSGGPFVGSFKIDNDARLIVLNEGFNYTYVALEYIASPKDGEVYYVPIQFKEAIISYLRWKDIISMPNSRKGTGGDKAQRRHEYFNDRRLAIARYEPLRLEAEYEWHLKNQRLTVKA